MAARNLGSRSASPSKRGHFFSLRFPFASFTTDQAKEGLLLAHVHVVLEELFTQTQICSKKHETDREGNISELHRWDFH